MRQYALSVKQPWATLLVHGLKIIEVRRWPTARRGTVLIHASRIPDHRQEAWAKLPLELHKAARQVGGIVGEGELTACVTYCSPEEFANDQALHRNEPSWFEPPKLFGFRFHHLRARPFRACPGWVRFFVVDEPRHARHRESLDHELETRKR